jgi:hypothetical protein
MTAAWAAIMNSIYYFAFLSIYAIYKLYLCSTCDIEINIFLWLILCLFLTLIVWYLYQKYQGIDDSKDKWDFAPKNN